MRYAVNIFSKNYSDEELYDLNRDIHECFQSDFNPIVATIPQDKHGFKKGTFKVTVEWTEEE